MSSRFEASLSAAKSGLLMLVSLVVFAYAVAGAAWFLWPTFTTSCPPLSVDTKIVNHHTSPSELVMGWASWPVDVWHVEHEAAQRGTSMYEVRRNSTCGL